MKKLTISTLVSLAALSNMSFAQSVSVDLKTPTINELGLTLSTYSYKEPSLSVQMDATNIGVEYQGTYAFKNNWFVLGEIDYNTGKVKYSGTGTQSGIPQYYFNLKAAVGYDFAFDKFVLSPYVGLGYRYLSQQWGGTQTSTGAYGYDRQSTYNYLPIGVIHRFAAGSKSLIETNFEYDYLMSGNQMSGLGALNGRGGLSGLSDVNNAQKSGYGLNLSVMYKEDSWGVGPYWKYWNIKNSETAGGTFTYNGTTYRATWYEPANNTNEFGIKVIYRF